MMEVACERSPVPVSILITEMCPLSLPGTDTPAEPAEPVVAVPRDQWPAWATAIAAMKTDADTGVGSTVDRLLGTFGKVYKATLKAMGVPCGCNARRAEWDRRYGY